jgi:hypothetical protein
MADRDDILLVVPRDQPDMASMLAERLAGVPGVVVLEDRRRAWPRGERRTWSRTTIGDPVPPGAERRHEQRRGSHEAVFRGAILKP